jgi:hypothetical protein
MSDRDVLPEFEEYRFASIPASASEHTTTSKETSVRGC